VRECLEGERTPEPVVESGRRIERGEDVGIASRRGHDRDVGVVLCSGPNHRRPTDVDLLDQLVDGDPRPLEGGREGIEVDDHQSEWGDTCHDQLLAMILETQVREQARVDPRMERLDPAVEHLRAAGHGRDVGHW
jgi:hypothetical protein